MRKNSFKTFVSGVFVAVVAGVILLYISEKQEYIALPFLWIWSCVIWLWEMLNASYPTSGWMWLFFSVFSLIGILNIYYGLRGDSEEPEWKTYIEDRMYGSIWRWYWAGDSIQDLWCFCPGCDATLVYDDSSCRFGSLTEPKTDFICENCRGGTKVSSIKGGSKYYAVGVIEREIQRRIRTGEYKKD